MERRKLLKAGGPLLVGPEMFNLTPAAGAPVVFVNVTVVSCEDPDENVWSPGGVAFADAGARLNRGRRTWQRRR